MESSSLKSSLSAALFCSAICTSVAHAVPVLQLGPDAGDTQATYDSGTQTWLLGNDGGTFTFNAYNLGTDSLTAYIIVASIPMLTTDVFDISVVNDSATVSLFDSGYGTPPFEDPNSIAPHGIYDTYSEIYEITFNGPQVTVYDVEPGQTGTASGYVENISITLNWADPTLTGIHIDLFTADWDETKAQKIVTGFAPFSHDAQVNDTSVVPVPAAVWLFGSGLLGLVGIARRKN